jgi:hypothetical protein
MTGVEAVRGKPALGCRRAGSRSGRPLVDDEEAIMAGEEPRPADSGSVEEVRQHEDEARRARADAEGDRAAAEREDERGEGGDAGVLPAESDEERTGVMPPPAGAGSD